MAWLLRKFRDAGLVGQRSQRSLCSYRWRHPLAEVQACGDCAAGRHQIRRLLRDRGKGRGRIRRTDARRRRPADIVGEVGQIAARTGWRLRRDALGISPDQAGYGFFPKAVALRAEAALNCHTTLSEDRGAGARRSRESRTGRSNSIVFGHKVRGGRLTCARHPWDIFKVTRCCRVVGGSRVLFSFGYGSNYLRR